MGGWAGLRLGTMGREILKNTSQAPLFARSPFQASLQDERHRPEDPETRNHVGGLGCTLVEDQRRGIDDYPCVQHLQVEQTVSQPIVSTEHSEPVSKSSAPSGMAGGWGGIRQRGPGLE